MKERKKTPVERAGDETGKTRAAILEATEAIMRERGYAAPASDDALQAVSCALA